MRAQQINERLKALRDEVVKESKDNLKRFKKNASGKLYESIKGEIKESNNEWEVIFTMLDYGYFQDKGVDGKRVKHGSEYSFKDKAPPPSALDKWIVQRGLAPRDKKGRFMTRKQQQFALSRFIYNNGIKRSLFFTKPWEQAQKNAGKLLQIALTKDVSIYMDEIITKRNRKYKKK
jgi:hypothetical protein